MNNVPMTMTFTAGTAITNNVEVGYTAQPRIQLTAILGSAWTAATLGVKGSMDGTNFYPIFDADKDTPAYAGGAVTETYYLTFSIPGCFRYLQLWSHNAGTPVNQVAQEVVTLYVGA